MELSESQIRAYADVISNGPHKSRRVPGGEAMKYFSIHPASMMCGSLICNRGHSPEAPYRTSGSSGGFGGASPTTSSGGFGGESPTTSSGGFGGESPTIRVHTRNGNWCTTRRTLDIDNDRGILCYVMPGVAYSIIRCNRQSRVYGECMYVPFPWETNGETALLKFVYQLEKYVALTLPVILELIDWLISMELAHRWRFVKDVCAALVIRYGGIYHCPYVCGLGLAYSMSYTVMFAERTGGLKNLKNTLHSVRALAAAYISDGGIDNEDIHRLLLHVYFNTFYAIIFPGEKYKVAAIIPIIPRSRVSTAEENKKLIKRAHP